MAAEVEMEKERPNIRIEIPNNLTDEEKMEVDVDENLKSDDEEGEIVDDNDTLQHNRLPPTETTNRSQMLRNPRDIFTTGINIFDKAEQEKLQERARRFALKPDEIRNFTEADLQELHGSLGITPENKNNVRFEAVHILGTNNLSTEDILDYFVKYAPAAIEWINGDSCNVTWVEEISAARAIFYVSKAVQGMPAREPSNTFAKEFIDDLDLEEPEIEGTGESILLKNKNRTVELQVEEILKPKVNFKNAVDISEITIPIPPGYWRLGQAHPTAKCLLLRFSLKTDKKPYKVESLTRLYKNVGANKGIISENRKREIRGIFDRNRDLNQEKNPWGSLAKNWNHDSKFCEKEPEIIDVDKPVEIKSTSIHVRLGKKPTSEEDKPEDMEDEDKKPIERNRNKLPRMRMYADEEEEKIKRKKMLQTLRRQTDKLSRQDNFDSQDLRNVLSVTNRRLLTREEVTSPKRPDLGTRLRNRTQNMVFTVASEIIDVDEYDRKENVRSDVRSILRKRKARSPPRRSVSPWERESPDRSRNERIRRSRSPLRRSPRPPRRYGGMLHSDRMAKEVVRRYRRSRRSPYYSDEEASSHKPRSKVAVVIKTQKKPAVASTIWSRVQPRSDSESDSESSSESGSSRSEGSSSSSESESGDDSSSSSSSSSNKRPVPRPGFESASGKLSNKVNFRKPLKITMTNDHFKK